MIHLTEEMLDPAQQEALRQVVTQTPEAYRRVVEQQELGMDGITRNEAGEYEQKGSAPDPSTLKAALDRVDKRMLSESPALVTYKLRLSGGKLVPDVAAYKREVK
jgi:hypothetical protein